MCHDRARSRQECYFAGRSVLPPGGAPISGYHDNTSLHPHVTLAKPGPQREQWLVDRAATYIREAYDRHSIVLEEFRTAYGIPDLLEIRFDQQSLQDRMSFAPVCSQPITPDAARLLCLLHFRDTTKSAALAELRFSLRRLSAALDVLADRNLIDAATPVVRARKSRYEFSITSIIAYEAKLKNWTRAVFQAQRHLWFADRSFVLLPILPPRANERLITTCQKCCVGLTIFQDGALRCVVEAEPYPVAPNWFRWYLNELLADVKSLDAGAI